MKNALLFAILAFSFGAIAQNKQPAMDQPRPEINILNILKGFFQDMKMIFSWIYSGEYPYKTIPQQTFHAYCGVVEALAGRRAPTVVVEVSAGHDGKKKITV